MKLFGSVDLIFHHNREVSCLSFPGTLMKWHCAFFVESVLAVYNAQTIKDFPVMV